MRLLRILWFRIFYYAKILLAISLLGGSCFLFFSGKAAILTNQFMAKIFESSTKQGLVIEEIYVSGMKNVTEEEILQKVNMRKGQPILAINLPQSVSEILKLDWVENVTIKRKIPNLIFIDIEEKEPIAIWQNSGKLFLVDKKGSLIKEQKMQNFANLPILIGENAHFLAHDLLESLSANSKIKDEIASIIRVGERRWNVRFRNGTEVKLPETDIMSAWTHVVELYVSGGLLHSNIKSMDLRVKDKIYIETKN